MQLLFMILKTGDSENICVLLIPWTGTKYFSFHILIYDLPQNKHEVQMIKIALLLLLLKSIQHGN